MDLDAAYRLVGVDRGVSVEEGRAAFRRRAKALHPDVGGVAAETAALIDAWRLVEADLAHARPRQTRLRRPAEHECEVCGTSPADDLTLRRVVGLVVVSPVVQARARVCTGCARSAGAEWQALTLIRGWWSIFGLIVTPFVFVTNAVAIRLHRRRAHGPQRRDPYLEVSRSEPLSYRSAFRPSVVGACLLAALLVAVVVVASVR